MTFKVKTILPGTVFLIGLAQPAHAMSDHVPAFDVRGSCKAAEIYDISEDRDKTFKGCLEDENRARGLIDKNWSHYKPKDRVDCITPGQIVAPSYVEILTCLEMSDNTGALLSKDVNQPTGRPTNAAAPIDPVKTK
jgi:hypothetical protein